MALYVVAARSKYNNYQMLRTVDSETAEVKDWDAYALVKANMYNVVNVANMSYDVNKSIVKFKDFDESRLCYLNDDDTPRVNKDGIIYIDTVNNDYVRVANYTGKIITVHMLQVGIAVRMKNAVLVNAYIDINCRIKPLPISTPKMNL